ncbi:MAG: alpha/beta hydrolase-fold protein [Myxococcota bacterium]
MVGKGALLGVLGLLLLGCGDDGEGVGSSDSGTGVGSQTTTRPPTTTISIVTSGPGESSESSGSTGADETGPPPDMPTPGLDDCGRLDALVVALPDAIDPVGMVDQFVQEVTYGEHGFPITCDTTLAVVHQGGSGQTLSLAGDFNEWIPGEHPLGELVPGLGFYYARVELPAAPEGLYKLVEGDDLFFADPLARRFGWDQFGEYSQVDAMPDRGHHERWPAFDQQAGTLQPRTVTVYLPAGALAEAGLPVLYMHDGQNLFSPEALFGGWRVSETLEAAIGDGTLDPLVVVGIDNTFDRFDEYTHTTDIVGGNEVGGRADEYADFLVGGVKPFVEGRYRVSSEPSQVAVMGSSLGGLVSLYIGRQHPDQFGHVGSMSGTIAWGTFELTNPTIVDLYLDQAPRGLRIYLDSGGDAGMGCPGGGFDNYCGNVALADALRGMGWVDDVDLFYRWQPGAPHNEVAWADRFLPALVEWFPAGR